MKELVVGKIKVIEIKEGHIYEAKRLIKNGSYRKFVRFNSTDMKSAMIYALSKYDRIYN